MTWKKNALNENSPLRLGFLESIRFDGDLLVGNRLGKANIPALTRISIADINTSPANKMFASVWSWKIFSFICL